MQTVPVFCGKDCGGNACPLLAEVEDGRVLRLRNNPAGPPDATGCARGMALHREREAPGRLTRPLVRTGPRGSGRFREADWDEALDRAAEGLAAARRAHGPAAVLNLSSWGQTSALHNTHALATRFLNLGGGCTMLSSNYSNGAARFALPYLYGTAVGESGFDPATMADSKLIVLWGANVFEARLGPDLERNLLAARDRSVPIVVIDPRRSATARRLGARWLPCRPGTDAALMLALLHVLFSEDLADRDWAAARARGFDRLEAAVLAEGRTPEWAEALCGTPAAEIRGLAREWAAARPALLLPGLSIQRVWGGEETFRLTAALQLATRSFGVRGGSTGSLNNRLPTPRVGTLPEPAVPGMPVAPMSLWPDLVLRGKAGGWPADIKAAYVAGGNLLSQGCAAPQAAAAFQALEFAVCHELFLTPTARHCDVVFPVLHSLEKSDIGIPWGGNFLCWKPAAVAAPAGCRSDYAVFAALAERLGYGPAFTEGLDEAGWLGRFLDQSEVADRTAFKATGVYRAPGGARTGLAAFAADPAGHPLPTPSGRVELASARWAAETGLPELPGWRGGPWAMPGPEAPADAAASPAAAPLGEAAAQRRRQSYPLLLITPKSPRRTHSQGGGSAEERDAQRLDLHPADATARGLADGDWVLARSESGAARARVRLDADLMPGVASLAEGIWYEPDADGVDRFGAANALTPLAPTLPGRTNVMHGIPVEVAAAPVAAD